MTKIKICGITNASDGISIAGMGVDFLGFIFYPPSPRYILPENAAAVIETIRASCTGDAPRMIGVFVDASAQHMQTVRKMAGLDGVQLSGDEPSEVLEHLEPMRFRGLSLETLHRLEDRPAEAWLCDTHAPVEKGGTGRGYDYSRLQPYIGQQRIIIAGGLQPGTVGDVVRQLRPWGVDVSSAVERSPGLKDLAAVHAFVRAVRSADEES